MAEPKIAGKSPKMVELESGTYHYCTCGQSSAGDFCDGSHQGTDFTPLEFEIKEKGTSAICMCKRTKTAPFCDGSHQNL